MELTKVCTACNTVKILSEFYKDSSKKSGYGCRCKTCNKKKDGLYRLNNSEKIKDRNKVLYWNNRESERIRWREYQNKNYEKLRESYKEYYYDNKEKLNQKNKAYRVENKEKLNEYKKKYSQENREKINERARDYNADWRKQNKIKYLEYSRRSTFNQVELLKTQYIVKLISNQFNTKISTADVSNELIELKRNSILLKRIIKQKIEENESTTHV